MDIFLIEEHHEAFVIWDFLGRGPNGPLADATLIHIDAHADMDLPWAGTDLRAIMTEAQVRDLVYTDLDIQTFITAAVYRGMFGQVVWVRPDQERSTSGDTYIWSDAGGGCRLYMSTQAPNTADARRFRYRWTGLARPVSPARGARVVLDIDLDFFSCSDTAEPARVAITEAEYHRFCGDRRHYLRCHFGSRVRAEARDGQYALSFTPLDGTHRAGSRQRTDAEVRAAVERLGQWLSDCRFTPEAVTLCRSRLSGYTPRDQWAMIESAVVTVMTTLYGDTRPLHIDDLIQASGDAPEQGA